ncbi:Hpt domain-containing protein [Shewanella psychromarinicola]|uniref:Hpt domain-containing protein n=1 Tax=Shewanella psychromarinicola TaxID=2487742 RepID=A0A3N4E310_9GAMM|nr:Hpt domain-containing protein [Shewanella psychromarinicola]AZG35454.1 Hpt domain-containing protein [Shewanella psychromarinicola]MCL1084111.1 Hpt domain-containing protein [Shewanella psychromarinicola]RPA31188.1 Hpt domain-containing protein [Shewanella psychromarinicola]
MTMKKDDLTIFNLQVLTDIYDDDSSGTIVATLSGFSQAAKLYLKALQQSFLADDLSAVSAGAHSLRSICGLTGVVRLASLSHQLELAAKAKQEVAVAQLMFEISVHWPVLEAQINVVLSTYLVSDA